MKPKVITYGTLVLNLVLCLSFLNESTAQQVVASTAGIALGENEMTPLQVVDTKSSTNISNLTQTQKSFITADGNIYWNKSLLVYHSLLTSPESLNTIDNFTVDNTPPISDISIKGPSICNIISPKTGIELSSADEKSGVRDINYRIGKEGIFKVYTSRISVAALEDGFHQIEYFSTDNVTNDENPNLYVFYLDKTAPQVSIGVLGDKYETQDGKLFLSKRSEISLSGSDNQAGIDKIHFNTDHAEVRIYSDSITTSGLEGRHSIEYYANDKVDNFSTKVVKRYTIDNTPPVIEYIVDGPSHMRNDILFVRSVSSFKLTPTDIGNNQAGIQSVDYQISQLQETKFNGSFSIKTPGLNSLLIKSSDNVNNTSELHEIVYVDDEAPVIITTFSDDNIGDKIVRDKTFTIYPKEVKLYIAAMDNQVGSKNIYYKLEGQSEKLYVTPLTGFNLGSNIELKVRAVDLLGNEDSMEISFSVE